MEEHERIELRSDDVQEILGTPPSWIVRWGTTVVFISVMGLLAVGWFIKYPDIIPASVQITTEMPPVPVVARTSGYLSRLMVKDGDSVRTGDLLVVLQSAANFEDILRLEQTLRGLESLDPVVVNAFQPDPSLQLGELQLPYSSFVQIFKDLQFRSTQNYSAQTVSQYQAQKQNVEKLIKLEEDKRRSAYNNYNLANKRFQDKQKLYMEKVVSLSELEDTKKELYRYELEIKSISSRIDEYRGSMLQIDKSITDVLQNNGEFTSQKFTALIEALNQLKTGILQWKQQYLMTAAIDGRVSFYNNYWAENQNIREGAEVMAIVPPSGNGIVGVGVLPLQRSGKVREGQRVIIKFDSYPYQEYGVVDGVVASKALLPKDNQVIAVRVSLPKGLTTTYNKTLKFDQQMLGAAEIITEDRRFSERVFDKIISIFKNR